MNRMPHHLTFLCPRSMCTSAIYGIYSIVHIILSMPSLRSPLFMYPTWSWCLASRSRSTWTRTMSIWTHCWTIWYFCFWLVDWLIDCLTCGFILSDWLIDWLIGNCFPVGGCRTSTKGIRLYGCRTWSRSQIGEGDAFVFLVRHGGVGCQGGKSDGNPTAEQRRWWFRRWYGFQLVWSVDWLTSFFCKWKIIFFTKIYRICAFFVVLRFRNTDDRTGLPTMPHKEHYHKRSLWATCGTVSNPPRRRTRPAPRIGHPEWMEDSVRSKEIRFDVFLIFDQLIDICNHLFVVSLFDWLIDWLVDGWLDWLVRCILGDCSIDWLIIHHVNSRCLFSIRLHKCSLPDATHSRDVCHTGFDSSHRRAKKRAVGAAN